MVPIPYYSEGEITIYHADCEDVLPSIDPSSVDLVLTDPPYGIGYSLRPAVVSAGTFTHI